MKAVYITVAEVGASIIAKVADENKKILVVESVINGVTHTNTKA